MIEVSFRFSRRDRSEVINSTIRMVSSKTDLFSKWTKPRYHIHQRDTAISLGCTPPLDRSILFYSCLKNDPIGPLLLMDILSRPPRAQIVNSFRPLALVSLGWGRGLPSTEYKKPYSCLTCWHPGEGRESLFVSHPRIRQKAFLLSLKL